MGIAAGVLVCAFTLVSMLGWISDGPVVAVLLHCVPFGAVLAYRVAHRAQGRRVGLGTGRDWSAMWLVGIVPLSLLVSPGVALGIFGLFLGVAFRSRMLATASSVALISAGFGRLLAWPPPSQEWSWWTIANVLAGLAMLSAAVVAQQRRFGPEVPAVWAGAQSGEHIMLLLHWCGRASLSGIRTVLEIDLGRATEIVAEMTAEGDVAPLPDDGFGPLVLTDSGLRRISSQIQSNAM